MKEKTFVTLIDPPNGTQCSVLKIKNDHSWAQLNENSASANR